MTLNGIVDALLAALVTFLAIVSVGAVFVLWSL